MCRFAGQNHAEHELGDLVRRATVCYRREEVPENRGVGHGLDDRHGRIGLRNGSELMTNWALMARFVWLMNVWTGFSTWIVFSAYTVSVGAGRFRQMLF